MNDEEKSREELLEELEALRRENRRLRAAREKNTLSPNQPKTILIVDDNEGSREMVTEMVEELGHTAIAAASLQQALGVFATNPAAISLIISDIVMPGGGGPHLLKEIAKLSAATKMIFMSGYAGDEIVHDAVYQIRDSDAVFIKKPFTLTQLEPLIQSQLEDTGAKD